MNNVVEKVIDKFHKTIESYVSVEEIIDLMDKITPPNGLCKKNSTKKTINPLHN